MMTCFSIVGASCVSEFRFKRKFHSYLFLAYVLLVIAAPVNARPKETESADVFIPMDEAQPLSEEYSDVDNIELHQAKIVNGMLKEDHPVIMYKEDFVAEDFVPKTDVPHHLRKHKDPAHRRRRIKNHSNSEQYHPLQPEKIYFDILSSAPIISSNEANTAPSKMHVEVISLADADNKNEIDNDVEAKRVLHKHTKKFHNRRQRRNVNHNSNVEHVIQKRNPYYTHSNVRNSAWSSNYYLPRFEQEKRFEKHPIPGNFYNGFGNKVMPLINSRFGGPDNTDRVIWKDFQKTRNPNQRLNITVSPPLSLFPQTATSPPRQSMTDDVAISRPNNIADNITRNQLFQTEAPFSKSSSTVCVWAITNCCTQNDRTLRNRCFERYGCNYVFWDLNVCIDNNNNNNNSTILKC